MTEAYRALVVCARYGQDHRWWDSLDGPAQAMYLAMDRILEAEAAAARDVPP